MLARKIILGFGFAVLMPVLIHYGIDMVAPRWNWKDFSKASAPTQRQINELRRQERLAASEMEKAEIRRTIGRLEGPLEWQREWHEVRVRTWYRWASRVHFFIGVSLGIIVTLVGSFIRVQAIGGFLMLGGIFTFTSSCWGYWSHLPSVGRFFVLLVAFVELLWIGYQRLSELKQPAKFS